LKVECAVNDEPEIFCMQQKFAYLWAQN